MVTANAIQQILSGDCAVVQDLDGDFYLLTTQAPPCLNDLRRPPPVEDCGRTDSGDFRIFRPQKPIELYNPPFFAPAKAPQDLKPHQYSFCLKIKRSLLTLFLESLTTPLHVANITWNPANPVDFKSDFETIQGAIQSGTIEKAVAITQEQSPWKPSQDERLVLLKHLLKNSPPHLFIYGSWNQEGGVLGATPELLFSRRGSNIDSMALAGTLAKNPKEPSPRDGAILLTDPKERFEHQLVVDDLCEKFETFFAKKNPLDKNFDPTLPPRNLHLDGPKVLELPKLFHLLTRIQWRDSQLNEASTENDLALIMALHPSSALGLRSKKSKTPFTWLERLRGHRDIRTFGAPFGLNLPDNSYLCLVAIRNLEWNERGSSIQAGCGIVEQSLPHREWAELEAKRNSIKALLGL